MSGGPVNNFEYVMARGQGNKGASYKYSWRPDWRVPPGVKQGRVFLQLMAILGIAAVPVYFLPMLRSSEERQQMAQAESPYVKMKKEAKAERKKWIDSDEMPYK